MAPWIILMDTAVSILLQHTAPNTLVLLNVTIITTGVWKWKTAKSTVFEQENYLERLLTIFVHPFSIYRNKTITQAKYACVSVRERREFTTRQSALLMWYCVHDKLKGAGCKRSTPNWDTIRNLPEGSEENNENLNQDYRCTARHTNRIAVAAIVATPPCQN
jgi:hypothetical protein